MNTTDALAQCGCSKCWHDEADQAWPLLKAAKRTEQMVDESHFSVSIAECAHCGQRFVWVFTETVDWVDGDDPQTLVVLPIEAEEQSALSLADADEIEAHLGRLGPGRRSLCWDHPKGQPAQTFWTHGITVGRHD